MSQKVCVNLKGKEKSMLVELDESNLQALDTPATIIHGIRTNKEGKVLKIGFNSSEITDYNYNDEEEAE